MLVALALFAGAQSAQAAFPGGNGKIAYADSHDNIWVRNVDGTGLSQLTNTFGVAEAEPAWSPEGTKIAFARRGNFVGDRSSFDIWLMNADSSNQTRLASSGLFQDDWNDPTWSPDGTKIAFEDTGHATIWWVNSDGSAKRPIKANARDPVWSPDGTKIAYTSGNLELIDADGVDISPTTLVAVGCCIDDPDWSPDGTQIVFSYRPPIAGGIGRLYVVNADGSGLIAITPGPQDIEPAWSPDGTKIAYITTRDGTGFKLHMVNPDGSNDVRLTGPTGEERFPDWQPIPGPQRNDYKNAAQFCKAERDFLGDEAFRAKYGTNGNGANAFGKCVSGNSAK